MRFGDRFQIHPGRRHARLFLAPGFRQSLCERLGPSDLWLEDPGLQQCVSDVSGRLAADDPSGSYPSPRLWVSRGGAGDDSASRWSSGRNTDRIHRTHARGIETLLARSVFDILRSSSCRTHSPKKEPIHCSTVGAVFVRNAGFSRRLFGCSCSPNRTLARCD